MKDNLLSSFVGDITTGSTSSKTKNKNVFFLTLKTSCLLVFEGKSLYLASCIDGKSLGLNELCRLKAPNAA
jgi:hypothetical protein